MTFGKIGARKMMHRGPVLPPGARWVEYLESTGTQWIDTGYIPKTYTECSMDFMFTSIDNVYRTPFSVRTYDGAHNSFTIAATVTNLLNFAFGSSYWEALSNPQKNTRYHATLKSGNATINGLSGNAGTSIVPTTLTAYMFARNANGTAGNFLKGRIYYCNIATNGLDVRKFHPIAIGTTGYMIDILTGEYEQYGNQGTGDFVIGPDAPPPTI